MKAQARRAARKRRRLAVHADGPQSLITHFPFARFAGQNIAGFWPIKDEIDVRPLLKCLHEKGHKLALPCTPAPGFALTLRIWSPDDVLKVGPYDTREPYDFAPELAPDVILVPLLAFSPDGYRLGYGGGFYDRTLAALRSQGEVFACGVAYAGQETPYVPIDQFDQKLDGILTDKYFKDVS